MYQTIDKTNTFYCYNHRTNEHYFIGNREQFISYLSRYFKYTEYSDTIRWYWEIIDEQNVTMNDCHFVLDSYYLREKTFYDGEYRIVDIRNYFEEAVFFYKNDIYIAPNKINHFKKRRYRKYYSGNHMRHHMPKTSRILRMDAPIEMKEFSRGTKKLLPRYLDDKGRRVSSSWKDQKKYKKQWMHKIDSKDCNTIRRYEED